MRDKDYFLDCSFTEYFYRLKTKKDYNDRRLAELEKMKQK